MTTIDTVTKKEYEVLAEFRHSLRLFIHFSEEAASVVGLTPHQHQALLAIQGYPGRDEVTVGELAERLQIRHHSAVGLVNRLEANGLVDRRVGVEDKRQVYVGLTPQGMAILHELSKAHRAEIGQLAPRLAALLQGIAVSQK